ncbi:hypothetical protein Tco_0800580 [Tanacetum coccineum]|uniref:Reverse transcriptase domain-containing protein n=1 Tax=Tanacetum coccineum TaxID=301880 RepID=A0ABQ4ZXL7_9ASTR
MILEEKSNHGFLAVDSEGGIPYGVALLSVVDSQLDVQMLDRYEYAIAWEENEAESSYGVTEMMELRRISTINNTVIPVNATPSIYVLNDNMSYENKMIDDSDKTKNVESIIGKKHSTSSNCKENTCNFAKIMSNNGDLFSNRLDFVPPDLDEKGVKVVIFEEELVNHHGNERFGFAIVLVEVNDMQGCQDSIKIHYYDMNRVKQKSTIHIKYLWKPIACNHCKVFGHSLLNYTKRPRIDAEMKLKKKETKAESDIEGKKVVEWLNEYNEAVIDEEKMLYQLAKVKWLKEGDKNSAYFHQIIKGKKQRSYIDSVYDEQGNRYNEMRKKISDDEIKDPLKTINDNKVPGPDGYTTKFFKVGWDIIGSGLCRAVLLDMQAFWVRLMPLLFLLFLRSKIQLRIVSQCQSAFIPGRSITDNILLTQDLLKGYGCRQTKKKCAFKIDIMKAYETYHHGCEDLKITNLCFDDLLIMCNGDTGLIHIIKQALEEFSKVSSLYPNIGKSTMFSSNISDELKTEILDIALFTIRRLPVRYLGVPLVTRRLSVADCKSLVEKERTRLMIGRLNSYLLLVGCS